MVMMCSARVELIRSTMAASVVDLPEPVTPVTVAPATVPVVVRSKLDVATPLTGLSMTTVQRTDEALVGDASASAIEATDGAARFALAGAERPSLDELAGQVASSAAELSAICRVLVREGSLVAVESNRLYSVQSVAELIRRLGAAMAAGADYGPAELRDVLGLTRKFLIPFLEYCDREGYTARNDLGRRRRGTKLAPQ